MFDTRLGTENADRELAVLTTDGASNSRVTTNQSIDSQPRFAPDGQRIVYVNRAGFDFGSEEIFVTEIGGQPVNRFEVRATDAAGNVESDQAGVSFVIDTIAPGAPALDESQPASPADDNTPRITRARRAR